PRHRTLLWNTPSTPTTASTTTQFSASRRAHIIEHRKSQPHRHQKRPRTGQYNDPILGQRINHAIEHGKSPLHRHHERPATTLTTTQSSASNHAHNLEHQRSTRHQHRPRPPGQPTPRPTTTPTTSNTRMTYDINNNHDHRQGTHQPPNNQPQYSGARHSGEAGRVTP